MVSEARGPAEQLELPREAATFVGPLGPQGQVAVAGPRHTAKLLGLGCEMRHATYYGALCLGDSKL